MRRLFVVLAALTAGASLGQRAAEGCGGLLPDAATAFPGSGAVDVSPYSSIFVSNADFRRPLTLEADGRNVSLGPIAPLGAPVATSGLRSWSRLQPGLRPGTAYVLRAEEENGTRELTRFTTATTYDKAPGTPAVIKRLRLWRVRYPLSKVANGSCVFSEIESYIDVDYEPGTVPATPPDEVINVLTLSAKTGGESQTLAFAGSTRVHLAQVEAAGGNGLIDVPEGGHPAPPFVGWKPVLSPDREYCVTLTLFGRNDLAALPTTSNMVCGAVSNVDTDGGGGCSVGGRGGGGLLWVVAALLISWQRRRAGGRKSGAMTLLSSLLALAVGCVPGASTSSVSGCVGLSTVAQNCPPDWMSVPAAMAAFCAKEAPFFDAFRSKGVCRGRLHYTRYLFDGGPRYCLYDPSTFALVGWGLYDGKALRQEFSCNIKREDFDDQGCEGTGCVLPDASVAN